MPVITDQRSTRELVTALRAAYTALSQERAATHGAEPRSRRVARELKSGALTVKRYEAWAQQQEDAPSADEQRAAHGGSWASAKHAAGLRACGVPVRTTTPAEAGRHLRRALRSSAPARAGCLSQAAYSAYAEEHADAPSLYMILSCYGSWTAATTAAGVAPRWPRHDPQSVEGRALLLAGVREVADRLQHAPSIREYDHERAPGTACGKYIIKQFGAWNTAVRQTGFQPAHKPRGKHRGERA